MKTRALLILAVLLCISNSVAAQKAGLDFIANRNQWPAAARFMAPLGSGSIFLTGSGFRFSFINNQELAKLHGRSHEGHANTRSLASEIVHRHAYDVRLLGCDTNAAFLPQEQRPNYYNFFLGQDHNRWAAGVPAYGQIIRHNVYPGIDLRVYSTDQGLKYDFLLRPGASASRIRLKYAGVQPVLTTTGDLLIRTSVNELQEPAPFAYQMRRGQQQQVACSFSLQGDTLSFAFPKGYDKTLPLVIDPALLFATYSGATSMSLGWSAAYDSAGHLYAAGQSVGTGWPVTIGAFQTTFASVYDVCVNKYSSSGSALIYSSYYGGNGAEAPTAIVVNKSNEWIASGPTTSTDLPVTTGCFDSIQNGGSDLFVARFNTAGTSLLGATYVGGSGNEGDVSTNVGILANRGGAACDDSGNIYIAYATTSSNFPTSAGAFQSSLHDTMDAIICKLNPSCSRLLFSTYLGGNSGDAAMDLKLNHKGQVVVAGGTYSSNFPGTANGWQSSAQGQMDGFIAVLDTGGHSVLHATYVGTSQPDDASRLAIDASGNIYAAGMNLRGGFPVSSGRYAAKKGLDYLARFDTSLHSLTLSTTIGDSNVLVNPTAFSVDGCGNVYFCGWAGYSVGLPTTSNAFQSTTASFWFCALSPEFYSLSYATYFGAVGDHVDGGSSQISPDGIMYHSLCTRSTGFPTTSSAWARSKSTPTNQFDIASWKFDFQPQAMQANFSYGPSDSLCAPAIVSFQNQSSSAKSFRWDFGDGSPASTAAHPPPHRYDDTGTYIIRLFAFNDSTCKPIDSTLRVLHVFRFRDSIVLKPPTLQNICPGDTAIMQVNPRWQVLVTPDSNVAYRPLGGNTIQFFPKTTTSYRVRATLTDRCGVAADTIQFSLEVDTSRVPPPPLFSDTILCKGDTAIYRPDSNQSIISIIPTSSFSWNEDSSSLRFFPGISTPFRIISVSRNRCYSRRDTMQFTLRRSRIKAAFDVTPKQTDLLDPVFTLINRSQYADAYDWYTSQVFWTNLTNPVYHVADTGTYCFTLVAKDDLNCFDTATDCGRVIRPLLYIPSAFTPNGDSKNDIFRPISHDLDILEFSVYNRFGQRVFVTHNNVDGWDGNFKGRPADVGTYFYQVRYRILQREPGLLKGDVTLIR